MDNISPQESLARKFESWQKRYYDDVYVFYEKKNSARLRAALDNWEDSFLYFLQNNLPRFVESYKNQTSHDFPIGYISDPVSDFKDLKSNNIEAFLAQCIDDARKGNLDDYKITTEKSENFVDKMIFVDPNRIEELRQVKNVSFDLAKLIRFCEELNGCYQSECYLAVAILTRALIDHISPIFAFNTFSEVVNNYAGTKSFKDHMKRLEDSSRKIADAHLHTGIRSKESLPTPTQVNFSNDIDVLLGEIIRILK
jgi:hypothetical protein